MSEGITPWSERALFVSSTFRDFQFERDVLARRVFPELVERLARHRIHFQYIDLRLGISTAGRSSEGEQEMAILKVCLREVARSRPFMLVLLGGRYGTVPSDERLQQAARESGFSGDPRGLSVTALEVAAGTLEGEEPARVFAYFRDLDAEGMSEEDRRVYFDDSPARVDELQQRLRERLAPDHCRRYNARWDPIARRVTDLDGFAQQVLDDFTVEFEAVRAPSDSIEQGGLDAFVHTAGLGFVGRRQLIDELEDLARSPLLSVGDIADPRQPWARVIGGPSGAGKSAVAAAVIRRLARTDVVLLAHAAGESPEAASSVGMVERWCTQLAAELGFEVPPESAEFFDLFLRVARRKRVVMVVDAVERLERTASGELPHWLPQHWPANARLIATCLPGAAMGALSARLGLEVTELAPPSKTEAREIVAGVFARQHREHDEDVVAALVSDRPRSPLWLILAAEELNQIDIDDMDGWVAGPGESAMDGIARMQRKRAADMPSDQDGMVLRLLTRAQRAVATVTMETQPQGWAAMLARLVAASRAGLRESDLRVLLPDWSDLRFAVVRRAYGSQFGQRPDGLWDFRHDAIKAAAATGQQPLHDILASHFGSLPEADSLRASAYPYHLALAGDFAALARHYETTDSTRQADSVLASLAAGALLEGAVNITAHLGPAGLRRALSGLLPAFQQHAPSTMHSTLVDALEAANQRLNRGRVTVDGIVIEVAKSDLARERGEKVASLRHCELALSLIQQLDDDGDSESENIKSVVHQRLGDALMVAQRFDDAERHFLASAKSVLRAQAFLARHGEAMSPAMYRSLAVHEIRLGDLALARGDHDDAYRAYRRAVEHREAHHRLDVENVDVALDLASGYQRLSRCNAERGETLDAYRFALRALAVTSSVRERTDVASVQSALAIYHYACGQQLDLIGDHETALRHFQAAVDGARALQVRGFASADLTKLVEWAQAQDEAFWKPTSSEPDASAVVSLLTQAFESGNAVQKESLLQRALWLAEGAVSGSANSVTMATLSTVLSAVGSIRIKDEKRFPEGLELLRRAVEIDRDRLTGQPQNLEDRYSLALSVEDLAQFSFQAGFYEDGLRFTGEYVALIRQLHHLDPENAVYRQRALASAIDEAGANFRCGKAEACAARLAAFRAEWASARESGQPANDADATEAVKRSDWAGMREQLVRNTDAALDRLTRLDPRVAAGMATDASRLLWALRLPQRAAESADLAVVATRRSMNEPGRVSKGSADLIAAEREAARLWLSAGDTEAAAIRFGAAHRTVEAALRHGERLSKADQEFAHALAEIQSEGYLVLDEPDTYDAMKLAQMARQALARAMAIPATDAGVALRLLQKARKLAEAAGAIDMKIPLAWNVAVVSSKHASAIWIAHSDRAKANELAGDARRLLDLMDVMGIERFDPLR